jgi:hypothetical protein
VHEQPVTASRELKEAPLGCCGGCWEVQVKLIIGETDGRERVCRRVRAMGAEVIPPAGDEPSDILSQDKEALDDELADYTDDMPDSYYLLCDASAKVTLASTRNPNMASETLYTRRKRVGVRRCGRGWMRGCWSSAAEYPACVRCRRRRAIDGDTGHATHLTRLSLRDARVSGRANTRCWVWRCTTRPSFVIPSAAATQLSALSARGGGAA